MMASFNPFQMMGGMNGIGNNIIIMIVVHFELCYNKTMLKAPI